MGDRQPTVFIVDADEQVRCGSDVVVRQAGLPTEQHAFAREFLAHYDPSWPGCLLLDVRIPHMGGLQLQQELNRLGAVIPVIFVAGVAEVAQAVEAMQHGAFDFLQKPVHADELLDRVRRALELDAATRASLRERRAVERRFASLSDREREILGMVLEGFSNKEAAARMRLSSRTVEIHRASLMRKTGARNTADLVRMALALQLRRSSPLGLL
jgi:two-component system, LuxR family, response regulator FixJ